jgi:hypothetical protein
MDSENAGFDIGGVALGTAGSLLGGTTTKILSATAAGLAGVHQTLNSDFLYNASVKLIIQQMEVDRRCWDVIIEQRLDDNSYKSIDEGFNDLMAYSRAGSFTQALVALQTATGAADSTNKTALQSAKAKSGKKSASRTPAKDPTQDGEEPQKANSSTSTMVNYSQKTCGAAPDAPTSSAATDGTQSEDGGSSSGNGNDTDYSVKQPDDNKVGALTPASSQTMPETVTRTKTAAEPIPPTQTTIKIATWHYGSVTMPFTDSANPVDSIIAATNSVRTETAALIKSISSIKKQIGSMKPRYSSAIDTLIDLNGLKPETDEAAFNKAIDDGRYMQRAQAAINEYVQARLALETADKPMPPTAKFGDDGSPQTIATGKAILASAEAKLLVARNNNSLISYEISQIKNEFEQARQKYVKELSAATTLISDANKGISSEAPADNGK